jgi:hypothetical protein
LATLGPIDRPILLDSSNGQAFAHILDMARKGAEQKYEELKAETAALVKNFPHLAQPAGRLVACGATACQKEGKRRWRS